MAWYYLKTDCENSHCSQEQGAAYSVDCCTGGELLQPLKSKITHAEFYYNGKLTESYLDSLSGTTFAHSMASRGEERSMSSAEDFRVRTSVAQGKVRASLENEAAYGVKWHESFAKYDRDSCSWKTHQCSLFGGLESFSETWPRWGMMRDGVCSERVMQEHHTSGTGSGLWPTPLCMDTLPPKSPEALQKEATQARPGRSQPANLRDCVHPKQMDAWKKYQQMYPTPSANEDAAGTPDGKMQSMLGNDSRVRGETKEDWKKGSLNPKWVEWLMGWHVGWTGLEPITDIACRDWQTDPADSGEVPRVATGVKHRVERLKAIGNGQVPAVAALAWQILTDQTEQV